MSNLEDTNMHAAVARRNKSVIHCTFECMVNKGPILRLYHFGEVGDWGVEKTKKKPKSKLSLVHVTQHFLSIFIHGKLVGKQF